jgi:hypothetical protein
MMSLNLLIRVDALKHFSNQYQVIWLYLVLRLVEEFGGKS